MTGAADVSEPNIERAVDRRRDPESGAVAVEYALLAVLIAVVISASVAHFGQEVSALFEIPCGALGPC